MKQKLYRIIRRTTGSLQPGSGATFWTTTVLYCGYDRAAALRVYHEAAPTAYYHGHGSKCCQVVAQSKEVTTA